MRSCCGASKCEKTISEYSDADESQKTYFFLIWSQKIENGLKRREA